MEYLAKIPINLVKNDLNLHWKKTKGSKLFPILLLLLLLFSKKKSPVG